MPSECQKPTSFQFSVYKFFIFQLQNDQHWLLKTLLKMDVCSFHLPVWSAEHSLWTLSVACSKTAFIGQISKKTEQGVRHLVAGKGWKGTAKGYDSWEPSTLAVHLECRLVTTNYCFCSICCGETVGARSTATDKLLLWGTKTGCSRCPLLKPWTKLTSTWHLSLEQGQMYVSILALKREGYLPATFLFCDRLWQKLEERGCTLSVRTHPSSPFLPHLPKLLDSSPSICWAVLESAGEITCMTNRNALRRQWSTWLKTTQRNPKLEVWTKQGLFAIAGWYGIISQNHTMAWFGRDHKDHQVPALQLQAGLPVTRSSLDEVAQGPIQPVLEHLPGWGIRNVSGWPVLAPQHPLSEKLSPDIPSKLPSFSLISYFVQNPPVW